MCQKIGRMYKTLASKDEKDDLAKIKMRTNTIYQRFDNDNPDKEGNS